MKRQGFTLIELLVVVAILGLLAAVLFPVFAHVRENGQRTACLSNERQLGMALFQYVNDNDELLPHGNWIGAGTGWMGRSFPYVNNLATYGCPDDRTLGSGAEAVVSYGLNSNLSGLKSWYTPAVQQGVLLSGMTAASKTVMLFEVSDSLIPTGGVTAESQSAAGNAAYNTAAGDGTGKLMTDFTYPTGSGLPLYATGNVGGRLLNGATLGGRVINGAPGSLARHGEGSNYLAFDGHARWLKPEQVSGGHDAPAEDCRQGTEKNQPPDCTAQASDNAAGTANSKYALTFSIH